MDVSLEVLVSTNIKRKKPCPRICWLGQEKECVFLVDERHVSEINLRSGNVKKTSPQLQALVKKKSIAALATSINGAWLAGLLVSGELFIWNKDLDSLQTVPSNGAVSRIVAAEQDNVMKLFLCVSGDGRRVLLASHIGSVFLWESMENKSVPISPKSSPLAGSWTQIQPHSSTLFPRFEDKEATVHAVFIKNEVLGDCCLCTFAFYSGDRLQMTFLSLRWYENNEVYNSSLRYRIHWAQQDCTLDTLAPSCEAVKSRGALLATFSRDGLVLAMAVNQRDPKATHILFINCRNFVTISGHLKGCSSKDQPIPSRFIRSYWVGDMAWTADSLFLACILKRGALVLLTRLGELLTLTTFGCSVEFGPAEFIPLHPLITYRPPLSILDCHDANNSLGSTTSVTDVLRQRYSVTCHARLPYLLVSDGYMVTALRFAKNLTPQSFMKSLLLDSAQRLENIRQRLHLSKPRDKVMKLKSLSSLKAGLLKDNVNPYSTMSTVPSFLQGEEEAYDLGDHATLQGDDEESDDEVPKSSVPSDVSFGRAEQGRLEFASMFDTIHASDQSNGQKDVCPELHLIQKTLLTAWVIGVTLRNNEEKDTLLNYTVGCLTHYLSTLQHARFPRTKTDKFSHLIGKDSSLVLFFSVLQQCLTVLYWDIAPRQAVGHMIKLTSEAVRLILVQHQALYSKNLQESFCLLKMVSQHLNAVYTLQFEAPSATSDTDIGACLDLVKIPIFVASIHQSTKDFSARGVLERPPGDVNLISTTEKRLSVLWRLLYNQTLWYQTLLRQHICAHQKQLSPKVHCEEEAVESLLCHIQQQLQCAGERLDQSLHLMPVAGEELFLLGSYQEAVEIWKQSLLEIAAQGGRRASLLQTRYYLAVLYCHLYNYMLSDAQGMCDQLVRELLRRSNLLSDTVQDVPGGSERGQWLLEDVHHDAALAVIQSMGRFMAAYFTNQLLYVFPPHNVRVLPPLHLTSGRSPRVVTLQHSVVASVIRDQNLSCVWTVEYALDLLLIGGLLPEAAWLASSLGDWKMSVSMGVAYNLFRKNIPDKFKLTELYLPLTLTPAHIFLEKLQSFLGHPPGAETPTKDSTVQKQFTDPLEEEDADLLFSSVQEMLKAAVMADAEIFTETFHQLVDVAKELSRKLPGLVPERLYLPAPPLYCPQPATISEVDPSDFLLASEKLQRQKLSGVLQRILLLLRAARCSLPAAQWYIKRLKRARKVMQKIRAKGSLPPLNVLPETLLNYANSSTPFCKRGPSGDHQPDLVSAKVLGCFRELCALCWMLHVREQLSYSCRQYQKARDNGKLFKGPEEYDPCETEHCLHALDWACRMLPFTRTTNCEELIQDIILSLVSELPPIRKVAEILVKAFPHPDEVRVPLREKYHSLLQRLRHSMVKGPEGEEMMSVTIHNVQRLRLKSLKRVQRNIGPVEMHMWEPAVDQASDEEPRFYDRFSLGNSLSRSTLTDLGKPHTYSDGDTLSEALMNDIDESSEWHVSEIACPQKTRDNKAVNEKRKSESSTENEQILPFVGTWEFEREDEEYTSFLDLFLSYLLERDLRYCAEPGIPFLTAFSHRLREHELNSLVFDVHTTLKRKLGKPKIQSVYRAGCCYAVNAESCNESLKLEGTFVPTQGTSDLLPNLTTVLEKPVVSSSKYFHGAKARSAKSGLFGIKDQRIQKVNEDAQSVSLSSKLPGLHTNVQSNFRIIHTKDCVPSEELEARLQAKFINEAKLVEWMIRWSDKRLFWSSGKAELYQSTTIRVKTSSAAILTSIWLLEKPYLGGSHSGNQRFSVPPAEYIVAPVLRQAERAKLKPQPCIDADNPKHEKASVTTVEGLVQEQHKVVISGASTILPGQSERKSPERPPTALSVEISVDPCEDIGNAVVEPIHVVSEAEDEQDEQPDTERSPNISVSIRPVPHPVEIISNELDVKTRNPEETIIQKMTEQLHIPEPAVVSCITSAVQTSSNVGGLPAMAPTDTAHQNAQAGEQSVQPTNTSDAVRQMFQDEMFRLLQLQQINFMSLMQVVGSSFAALPALQQVLQQSTQVMGTQRAEPAARCQTPCQAEISHRNVTPHEERPARDSDATEEPVHRSGVMRAEHEQSSMGNIQNLPGLSISLSDANNEGKIPASQGLLTEAPSQGLPLIHPSSGVRKTPVLLSSTKVCSNLHGFPLLKLQPDPRFIPLNIIPRSMAQSFPRFSAPPIPREAWGPVDIGHAIPGSQKPREKNKAQPHADQNQSNANQWKSAQERERWAELVAKGSIMHSPVDHYGAQTYVSMQNLKTQDTRRRHQSTSARDPPHTAAGMPLLHLHTDPMPSFQPVISADVRGPMIPSRPKPASFTPLPQTTLTLLKSTFPQHVQNLPVGLTPKLIPLQSLIAFEQSRGVQGTAGGALQLLQANIAPFEEVKPSDSIKRQKRRIQQEKGERKEKRTSVTFRPEASIINPNNFDDIVQIENVKNDEAATQKSKDFIIPIGAFESLLSEKLPEPQITSVAELHFIASTKKKAPEIQDASTNTDTAESLPTAIPPLLPPDVYLNLRFLGEDLEDKNAPPQASEIPPTHVGRHYINVIDMDIDAEDLLKALPDSVVQESSPVEKIPNPRVPSSAELHNMAASVTNAVPPSHFQHTESFVPNSFTPRQGLEDPLISAVDPVTHSLLSRDPQTTEPETRSARARGITRASSKLKEIDAQLAALDAMAHNMEQDFANTELLFNTIESLTTAIDPNPEGITRPSRGVGGTERALRLAHVRLEDLTEEDEDSTSPSPAGITSRAHSSDGHLSSQSPPREKRPDAGNERKRYTEESFLDDPLQITGLSDIADILGDLMDGGVPASELGLTETQAEIISRGKPQQAPSRNTGKRSERERTELQLWMKKKQRERLAEHRRRLDALREMEHDPFQPSHDLNRTVSSKTLQQSQRVKYERDKSLLSEHHSHRISDAMNLMQEMLSEAKHLPVADPKAQSGVSRSPGSRVQTVRLTPKGSSTTKRSWSAGQTDKRRPFSRSGLAQPRSVATPTRSPHRETTRFVLQKSTLSPKARAKSAASYPVQLKYDASLPGDRMSQITRRGLLAGRNKTNVTRNTSAKPLQNPKSRPSVSLQQDTRNKGTNFQLQDPERVLISPWDVPDEIRKILNIDRNSTLSQGSLFNAENEDPSRDRPKLDNSSESTGSILSKLDWNTIEDMLASVEDT